ncbi:guanine nucleotide-binding protein-like 1 [Bacillus rossius redtenbacheri]|uniref:guanine nucleotide-binding protein-like 1 n=1 Tax=Bacillus rossius redtenbacheri TaxID=93214 RepID=UPI002FDE44AE
MRFVVTLKYKVNTFEASLTRKIIMPQGHRKVPFSGKAKKTQLQAKKVKQGPQEHGRRTVLVTGGDDDSSGKEDGASAVLKINQKPMIGKGKSNPNRYALRFHRETEAELRERKEQARMAITSVPERELEVAVENFFPPDLEFPKRPPWNFNMSREQLEALEHKYFTEYVSLLEQKFGWKELSYFELNLETWRQLWRVLEMSDIILVIVDIRFAALMFPPSLYKHVTGQLHKDMILVLNKVDLAPAPLVAAWRVYFQELYPSLTILTFTSFPGYNLRGNHISKSGLQVRRRKGKLRMAAEGARKLLEACKHLVQDGVDLTSWQEKIGEEMELEYECDEVEVEEMIEMKKVDTTFVEHVKYRDGVLTIGCVGQPNVGKSSLMNAIMGKKVVSVSRTPGHTKHFQTIHLTSNIRLCDCPGLVFPSKVPKTLQVLMGSFPIAQLREPYSSIRFLAERLNLPRMLAIRHPDNEDEWSAIDICDGWAVKRGYCTARTARPDTYRAANDLLRMALDGKLCLCLRPPGFTEKKEYWEGREETAEVRWIQALDNAEDLCDARGKVVWSDDDDGDRLQATAEDAGTQDETYGEEEGSEGSSEEGPPSLGTCNKFAALTGD